MVKSFFYNYTAWYYYYIGLLLGSTPLPARFICNVHFYEVQLTTYSLGSDNSNGGTVTTDDARCGIIIFPRRAVGRRQLQQRIVI